MAFGMIKSDIYTVAAVAHSADLIIRDEKQWPMARY